MNVNAFEYIQAQRSEYETRTIPLVDNNDDYSQYETLRKINYYWRNKYLTGAKDKVIGSYPFDNISKYRVLLEARATDFDTKHIEVEPKRPDRVARLQAMLATKAIHRWVREHNFHKTLNDIAMTRPKFGGVLVKNSGDGVYVVPWENLITDQSDIMAGVIIERHYFTPAQLKKQTQWDNLDEAIQLAEEIREKDIGNTPHEAKTQGHLIEVYEMHGEIPVSMLKEAQGEEPDEGDDLEYQQSMIVVCGTDHVNEDGSSGLILYADSEKEMPYMYLPRNPITGRGLGEGVVESLFEHQKWHNFTKTEEMRMIAIAGKKVYVTDDSDVLTNIFNDGVDHGTVLRVREGRTITELNQLPTGVPVFQSMRQEWDQSADRTTSSFQAKIGEEAKSGTPFRAQYLQNVEASSQFEQYREEIGEDLIRPIVEKWILPQALKEMASEDELFDVFSPRELQFIDEVIREKVITHEFFRRTVERETITPETLEEIRAEVDEQINASGSKRLVKQFKKLVKDTVGDVKIHTTDEARNKAVRFESFANALQLLAPNDPRRDALVDRIMDTIGVSKDELTLYMENDVNAQGPRQGQQQGSGQGPQQGNPSPQLQTEQMSRSGQGAPTLPLA